MTTTTDVAKLLEVTAPTIRSYTRKFGQHLSPEATPPAGHQRRFTADDVAVLRAAKSLLAEGLTYSQADERLGAVDLEEFRPVPTVDGTEATAMVPASSVMLIVQPYVDQADQLRTERDQALAKVEELQRQVGELSGRLQARRPPRWWAWLFGER